MNFPDATLMSDGEGLPEDMVDDFRETGTSHVLAISGLHLSILLGIGLAVGQWLLGRRRQAYLVLPLLLIWLYALISGMSPIGAI
jgi:competence protein ComEC